jgi:hypothetical protein
MIRVSPNQIEYLMIKDKKRHMRTLSLTLALAVLTAGITGCGALRQRNPVPESLVYKAELPDMGDIRITLDPQFAEDPKGYSRQLEPFFQSIQKAAVKNVKCCEKELVILSLSGGGENGAFGAGILNGWTASGTRPVCDIVTGISTGALQAPFAFLGEDYDATLKVYSTIRSEDVFQKRPLGRILQVRDAVADFTPLSNLIARLFGETEFKAVAREYNRGRLLLIGTTNLDAQQLVIWNMGAIAASGHPDALNLFRKVMIASSSIPVAVPPVYFTVKADGKRYDEMHVDGGVMTQVFGVSLLKYAGDAWRENRGTFDVYPNKKSGARGYLAGLCGFLCRGIRFQPYRHPDELRRRPQRTIRPRIHESALRFRF